jgi:modulator of FtsH protease
MDKQFLEKRRGSAGGLHTARVDAGVRAGWEGLDGATGYPAEQAGSTVDYLKQVYALLGASLLLAVAAGYVGMGFDWIARSPMLYLGAQLGLFALVFFVRNAATLFLFTGLSGFLTGPIVAHYVHAGMSSVVGQAFFLTGVTFAVLTVYAMQTRRDLSGMGSMMFAGLVVLVVGGLVNLFLRLPMLSFALSAMGALIFSGYLLWETQRLKQQPWVVPAPVAALSMYLNVLNLFLSLLQLLGFASRDD